MRIVQVTEDKKHEMSEMVEDILHIGGRLMSCIENLDDEAMGERRYYGMGMRDGGRYGMGMRVDGELDGIGRRMRGEYYPEPVYMDGERRDRMGRYMPK